MSSFLQGKVAVVTGGARGIGLAVCHRYAEAGATVVVADVDAAAARAAAAEVAAVARPATEGAPGGGPAAHGLQVDVSDEESVRALVAATTERAGRVDVVVANAGVLVQAPALDTPLDAWQRALAVNLTGAFLTCREFGRLLVEQGDGGRVILSSSLFGLRGGADNAAYSATKFGLVGLTQCLAAEWGRHGILVNAVCPGQVDTPMLRDLFRARAGLRGTSPDVEEGRMLEHLPLGRLAGTDEVADAYVFLASDLARYVTGQAIAVDGGWQVG